MIEGKAIWGSTRYFINIEPNTNLFSTAMGGRVAFYDNRGLINEKQCNNLHQIAQAVYEFWSTILTPHETRVARWIEEFFGESAITADYQLILRLLRSADLLEQPLEDLISETKKISTEEMEEKLGIAEDNKIIGKEISLTKLPDDEYTRRELLQKLIEENKYKVPSTVSSKAQFTLPNGELASLENENNIEIGETIGKFSVTSGIENTYDGAITGVEIRDQMPYCFKVDNMKIEGANIEPLKRKDDETLEIIWEIPEVAPKQKIEINYDLKRKINRTILEIIENEVVATLNTFETITTAGLDFTSETKYMNVHNKKLQEIFIIDDIPPEFSILRTNPDVIPPAGAVEKAKLKGITVRWNHKNVNAGQTLDKTYQLDYFPYLFRAKKIVEDKNGAILVKTAKFIHPSLGEAGYKLSYILKNMSGLKDIISITDMVPSNHVVTTKEPEDTQIVEENVDETLKKITWIVEPPEKSEEKQITLTISGDTAPLFEMFKIAIGEREEKESLAYDTSVSRDMIKLPSSK